MKKYLYWLFVILWLAVIYYFSAQPALGTPLDLLWDVLLRKFAHFSEYFVLVFLLSRALKESGNKHFLFLSLAIAIIYAATDEYHQNFVLGRIASPVDWGIDSLGAILAGFLLWRKIDKKIL